MGQDPKNPLPASWLPSYLRPGHSGKARVRLGSFRRNPYRSPKALEPPHQRTAQAYELVSSPLHALSTAASGPRPGHWVRGMDSGQRGQNRQFKCPRCLETGLTRCTGKTLLVSDFPKHRIKSTDFPDSSASRP